MTCVDGNGIMYALYNVTTGYAWFSLKRRESRANNREAYKDANQGAVTNSSPSKIYMFPRAPWEATKPHTRPSPSTSEGSEELVIN